MDNIIEPNEDFPFSKLSLTIPSGIQGGAYFTKIQFNNKPLYIQTTKSLTRQGFVKTGKKYYCDLMFDKNSEGLIQWFENLEETCQKLIYSKSDSWFQTTLEMNDIETAFNSPIRVYKSGKYYLLRVNIKTNHTTGDPTVKIYDENEIPLGIQDIQPETNIISILEIQGIKFTNRNFQIDIELKQIMVLNEPIFDNCLIKKSKNVITPFEKERKDTQEIKTIKETNNLEPNININAKTNDIHLDELEAFDPFIETNPLEEETMENSKKEEQQQQPQQEKDEKQQQQKQEEKDEKQKKELETVMDPFDEKNDDLKEFNISFEPTMEPITLKKPNEVYYNLYKQARKKAKEAKKSAIIAYLEAKNIKKTYMLENLDDSDDDFDDTELEENEIDDF
jgi:hypothetical protein